MIFADGFAGLLLLGLWIFCIIDVISTDPMSIRNLPKFGWLLIVLILPDIGSIAWLVAGHPWASGPSRPLTRTGGAYPEYDRPGRAEATNPDEDERFLRQVRERAEAQRREYERRRKTELQAERDDLTRRPPPEAE